MRRNTVKDEPQCLKFLIPDGLAVSRPPRRLLTARTVLASNLKELAVLVEGAMDDLQASKEGSLNLVSRIEESPGKYPRSEFRRGTSASVLSRSPGRVPWRMSSELPSL